MNHTIWNRFILFTFEIHALKDKTNEIFIFRQKKINDKNAKIRAKIA